MVRTIRTAIVASVSEQQRQQAIHLLASQNIALLAVADSGCSALRLLAALRPDLLVVDAQLPAMDGAALVRRALCTFSLPVRPTAMLLHYPEFPIADAGALRDAGAVLMEKPVSPVAFAGAIEALQIAPPVFSGAQLQHAGELLDTLGVPEHIGRTCLRTAALLCAADERYLHSLSGRLYPLLARLCHLEIAQAERAMRHAIALAWQSDKFDNQYRIFADTVDAGRGQPTCGEMISRLADILRLEG